LSRHLQTLEQAGLVEVWKGFQDRRPQTLVRLSPKGRERFLGYLEELERVVRDAAKAREIEPSPGSAPIRRRRAGWSPA
jgi:DNA-binding MarR family transcriptional regulator